MVAITSAVVVAGTAAYAAHSQASAANNAAKAASGPKTQDSTSTSTTTHGSTAVQDALNNALSGATALYNKGPILRKGSGSGVDPTTSSIAGKIEQLGQKAPTTVNDANSFLQNLLTGGKSGAQPSFTPATAADLPPALAAKVKAGTMTMDTAVQQASANRPDFNAKFGPGAQAAAANAPPQSAARQALSSNPVAQDLYSRLSGSSLSASDQAIRDFMNGGNGGGPPSAPAGNPSSPYYGMGVSGGGTVLPSGGMSRGNGPDSNEEITDQSTDDSLFSKNAQAILGGKYMDPNDPSLKGYLDALDHRNQTALQQQLDQVGNSFNKIGMYGGSGQALTSSHTQAAGLQNMSDADASAIFGARQQGLQQIQDTLGQVNQRDIAGSGMASNEEIAAANRAASASGNAASLAQQLAIETRGQNLSALGMLTQNNQFGVGQLGGLASGLSQEQMNAAQLAPSLNEAQYTGLGHAFDVSKQMQQMRQAAAGRNSQIAYQNANAAGVSLDDYMRRLGYISNAQGTTTTDTSHGTATGPSAGSGVNPNAAAIAGAAGAGLAAWGSLSQNNGNSQPPPIAGLPT